MHVVASFGINCITGNMTILDGYRFHKPEGRGTRTHTKKELLKAYDSKITQVFHLSYKIYNQMKRVYKFKTPKINDRCDVVFLNVRLV